jgi:hypothetical protein
MLGKEERIPIPTGWVIVDSGDPIKQGYKKECDGKWIEINEDHCMYGPNDRIIKQIVF